MYFIYYYTLFKLCLPSFPLLNSDNKILETHETVCKKNIDDKSALLPSLYLQLIIEVTIKHKIRDKFDSNENNLYEAKVLVTLFWNIIWLEPVNSELDKNISSNFNASVQRIIYEYVPWQVSCIQWKTVVYKSRWKPKLLQEQLKSKKIAKRKKIMYCNILSNKNH